ncbi:MAG: outer membrane protein assembly factor BamE [Hyphomonadaceae bacterium]|nr:outer membrane protein assembly factor BamE [Hyphomonadaceae bacterium]
MQKVALVAALSAAGLVVAGCNPIRDTHGFTAQAQDQLKVEPGVDTKSTVLARLGSPSTQSAFDQTAWYYITTIQERYAFYKPQTVNREILVVKFDEQDKVATVDRYGMERGQIVSYNGDRTPTRGRELGLLEQIFGNIGGTPPIRTEEDPRDRRR